ncbi:MAG: (2Fe-2S)-binding protein [Tenericutes bacterium HGW-Tenericutes-1]|jgi:carbon-monoxide dehydrogenase small subunit|nr:MAG: (2Fe-2S)-binding protein [Tenericutes bacterium HGW-Tenericutes-1]
MLVNLFLNGEAKTLQVEPGDFLLDTLQKNNVVSVRRGCESTSCGVCTVLLEGKPVPSCSLLTVRLEGKSITTVEGIQKEAEKLAHYFGLEGADQCGFCNPSMALTVYAMKKELKDPTIETIKSYLVGNLCRCTGYQAQHIAILHYLEDQS